MNKVIRAALWFLLAIVVVLAITSFVRVFWPNFPLLKRLINAFLAAVSVYLIYDINSKLRVKRLPSA